jgi:hypothetical protein
VGWHEVSTWGREARRKENKKENKKEKSKGE